MISIRNAELKDIEQIKEIYNEAVLNTTSTFDTEPKTTDERIKWLKSHDEIHPILVIELDEVIAGWASLSKWSEKPGYSNTAENSVYIKNEYQGKGLGSKLLSELLKQANDSGFHTVIACIADYNPASVKLHETAGYTKIGILKEAGMKFNKLIDVTLMQKIF